MSYITLLNSSIKRQNNRICMGIDPNLDRIPMQGSCKKVIVNFYCEMLDEMNNNNCLPAACKPNIAFFEQYGMEGLEALHVIIKKIKTLNIPVILDAKRGDIGHSSRAYAKTAFECWQADAVTVAPYMGYDSIEPFLEYTTKGKGIYLLVRNSNPGARDFQDLQIDGLPLYLKVAEKLSQWYQPGLCAVVGATYPQELQQLSDFFSSQNLDVPFLIPGIGTQGGEAREISSRLTNSCSQCHLINSSSGINYAWQNEKYANFRPAEASCEAFKQLAACFSNIEQN